MVEVRRCEVLVVGGGPGGYVAGIRSAQLGLDTVIVEGSRYGGTCLIRGCIPSKAIIHAAERFESLSQHAKDGGHMGISVHGSPSLNMKDLVGWKDSIVDRLNKGVESLLKTAGAEVIHGWATFTGPKTCRVQMDSAVGVVAHEDTDGATRVTVGINEGEYLDIEADNVILATGSSHIDLPFMPCDEELILSSTGALDLQELPETAAIVGGGYIGLELGCALAKLGTKVTVIEGMGDVLAMMDKEIRRPLEIWLKKHGVEIYRNALARGAERVESGEKGKIRLKYEMDGENHSINVDRILVTVGRKANLSGWGLEETGVRLGPDGRFIRTDRKCRTNIPGVYAIGDVAGEPMLAHKASAEGEMVAEIISGLEREFDNVAIPAIVFTEPEIVSVGLDPDSARERGEDIITGKFPLAANGRALTLEAEKTAGFIRVTARKSDHVILGIQAVGSHVAELHGEFVLALEMGAVLEDIEGTIHAHPTMTEAFHESVLKTLGHAIHSA